MTTLLQVSDPHFGCERAAVVAALEAWVHTLRPDVLLLSGDITQRATTRQFEAARAFVERLRIPSVLAIAGNHDIPLFNLALRIAAPYARYRQAFGDQLEPQFENDDVLVLALNTTRWYRHAQGAVSAAQIDAVARRVAQARPTQRRIVVVHQPIAVTREEDRENLLHGHAAAVARWAQAGVDMVLGGHIHLPFVLRLAAHASDPARALWAVQAGTAVSARVRPGAGNSVNVIRVSSAASASAPECIVERWDHAPATGRFERVAEHRLHAQALT